MSLLLMEHFHPFLAVTNRVKRGFTKTVYLCSILDSVASQEQDIPKWLSHSTLQKLGSHSVTGHLQYRRLVRSHHSQAHRVLLKAMARNIKYNNLL